MRTTLDLDGLDVDLEQYAVTATITQARPSRWSFSASLGAIVDGSYDSGAAGMAHDVSPGVVGSLGAARGWSRGPWFVTGSFTAGVSRVKTRSDAQVRGTSTAGDARIGVIAGRRFGVFGPYALARAFGGPVLWSLDGTTFSGGDAHHYQLGVGANVTTRAGVSLVLDLALLGERAASLGVALEL